MSKKFLSEAEAASGIFAKLSARSVVAVTLCAVQFLGQTIAGAMDDT